MGKLLAAWLIACVIFTAGTVYATGDMANAPLACIISVICTPAAFIAGALVVAVISKFIGLG